MSSRFTVVAVAFCLALKTFGDDGATLNLNACYELALAASEKTGIAAAQWKAAEARYRQAHDTWLPDLDLDASQTYRNSDSGSGDNESRSSRDDVTDVRFRASQPLYRGFRLTRLAEARKADLTAAEFDRLRVNELLYLDVADAYYLLLALQRQQGVLDELVKALEQIVETFEERVSLGQSRRADLLSAKTDLAEALVDNSSVGGQVDAARHLMSFLTGLPASGIVIGGDEALPVDVDTASFRTSITERLDIKAGEARREAALLEVKAAKGDRQPSLDAEAGYVIYEQPDEDRIWEVGFALNIPLFDDGARRSVVRERMASAEINELELSQLRREAALEVENRIIALQTSIRQLDLLKEAVSVAEQNYELQQEDYLLGRSTQLDALSALAQWHRLQLRESNADAVARAAYASLKVAAGVPVP